VAHHSPQAEGMRWITKLRCVPSTWQIYLALQPQHRKLDCCGRPRKQMWGVRMNQMAIGCLFVDYGVLMEDMG